ncbi:bifunctional proline dehydrogenase/L-glutamate gamma-semialdehyde dehydrogenase [Homoserinibacter sp. GY 40078]|uniref:bifunctional proline dehydrogenase/L-glutamate gamma-semialdehyde dehydrogenase n=1 Tax=Homoserinibacter sp. GY 40078 TaxID=2603275 RepID=UPI0011C74117|nr:bifunctional proline dehydrogenase/L-glutamate gamma-semialdehyde dehydrogenase [Homoserinibacter sp. GY 40078]TXK19006.1 aldehyde dehydrogenase family protein [Homoserinibacter sp. GY 40078]
MAVASDLPTPDEVTALVRRWLAKAATADRDPSAERLAGLLKDPVGLEFTLGFVDRVVRPEDLRVAARNLERLSRRVPRFLPWYLRALVVIGGGVGVLVPWPVIPLARRVLRRMVEHLVIDATPDRLGASLTRLRGQGARLNINLLGEAVLGEKEAQRRLDGTRELLERSDVDYVSIKVSSVAAQLSMWGFDETVERVVRRLTPLYEYAASSRTAKFINLDMEEYRDLDLTIAVFTRLLDQPALRGLEAGIVLQAYLPDSVAALHELTAWARRRVASGGAGIKVRIVKGANLAMERADAELHGWPLATWPSKRATDTNYKRMLVAALTPTATDAVRIGVAGHNLFDLAFAWLLASGRGVESRVDIEMLLGMATAQAQAVRADTRRLLLYTPVVHPAEFDSAISYLVRRLEENASDENYMSAVFDLADDERAFAREAERFADSLAGLDDEIPPPNRTQNRLSAALPRTSRAFHNEPDTDPALVANRVWGRSVLERSATSRLGVDGIAAARVDDPNRLDEIVRRGAEAGARWGTVPPAARAELLDQVAEVLAVYRGRLVEVMAAETGKTIAEADVEVSEAVDFASYYAERARELAGIRDARFEPVALTLVTPPWNFPVSIPAGGVLSALAAGSAVILKPAPQSRRAGAVLAEAMWEAGVPRELLALVDIEEGDLGRRLVTAPAIGRVVLTGSSETAELFRSWRPDLPLLAETSGKNAIVVTPSADLDLAAKDIVQSAFGNAGQKCSAASLAILVGSVGESERFRRQLADAVASLSVGYPQDPAVTVGPLVEPVQGKLARGLTRLAEGESWLVKPRQLDGTDRLWAPGVRDGVVAGSDFHRTEFFGPVLGIMRAADLDEALALQNGVAYGLTAGIHSLDLDEVSAWIDRVQAGNLYVNRPITGAIVRRQPFGGWKRSSVGPGAKAGGPNTLLVLGAWRDVPLEPAGDLRLDGLAHGPRAVVEAFQPTLDYAGFDRVRRGAFSDAQAWEAEFGVARDASGLGVERNILRYRPTPVTVRLAEGAALADLVRVLAAGARAGSRLAISSAAPLRIDRVARELGWTSVVESDAAFATRAARELPARIRLVGGDAAALAHALGGSIDVAIYAGEVTSAGRIELLPFLHEQAVSITAHRFGNPDPAMIGLPV